MGRNLLAALQVTALLVLLVPAEAQTTFGTITGIITDQSGAVIANTPVVVRNEATGQERQMKTSDTGIFVAPNLGSGPTPCAPKRRDFNPRSAPGWNSMQTRRSR